MRRTVVIAALLALSMLVPGPAAAAETPSTLGHAPLPFDHALNTLAAHPGRPMLPAAHSAFADLQTSQEAVGKRRGPWIGILLCVTSAGAAVLPGHVRAVTRVGLASGAALICALAGELFDVQPHWQWSDPGGLGDWEDPDSNAQGSFNYSDVYYDPETGEYYAESWSSDRVGCHSRPCRQEPCYAM